LSNLNGNNTASLALNSNKGDTGGLWIHPQHQHLHTHLNARHVLGDTPTGVYFTHFTNKQFHNLTTKKSIPAMAVTVLSFGLKFIPVPKKSIHQDDVNKAIKQFDQDFYLKVSFTDDDANSDDKEQIKKL
jgi:hypothetical protein